MTDLRSTRPVINGHRHWLVEAGPKGALPLVFVHGFPFSHAQWAPQLEAFSDRYHVAAYDLRGMGRTEVGDGQYTMEFYVDDLMGVLDHLDLDRAVVCGLSMGGYVVLRAAEREPERFLAVVLCDTRSGADGNAGKVGRSDSVKNLKRHGIGPFVDGFLPKVLGARTLSERPDVVRTVRGLAKEQRPLGLVGAQLAMAARTDTTEALQGLRVPALIVVGDEDALTPPAESRAMAARIPDSELVVLPGAGHVSNLEDPEAFNAALGAFLARIEGE